MPLLSANVMILEAGPITGVITDQDGIFNIEDVPVGRYNVLVSHMGYQSLIKRDVMIGSRRQAHHPS